MCQKFFSPRGIIKFLPILACLIITGLNSCNSKTGETATTTDTTTTGDLTTTSTTASTENSFYTLQLDSATLVELFADNSITKLVVQVLDSNKAGPLGLVAYGLRTNNVRITGPKFFKALPNTPTTFSGYTILGDQELTVRNIKDVLVLSGGGPINPAQFRTLQFVPLRDGNRHLYYSVTVLNVTAAAGSANTNPSPPAPPCDPCE